MTQLIRYVILCARRLRQSWLYLSIGLCLAISVSLNYALQLYRPIQIASQIPQRVLGFALFYGVHFVVFVPVILACTGRMALLRSAGFLRSVSLFWFLVTLYSAVRLNAFQLTALFAGEWLFFIYRAENGVLQFLLAAIPMTVMWMVSDRRARPFGITVAGLKLSPYLMMLVFAVPCVFAVSFSADFRAMYPRYFIDQPAVVPDYAPPFKILQFFLVYAVGFIGVELFFRGLALQILRPWLGYDAIVLAAAVYCLIHFQKPLLETISSFFGALLLGLIAMRTGSILGGMVAHVGLAWMMELAGHIQILVLKNPAPGRLF